MTESRHTTTQIYSSYSPEDHIVWQTLYHRQDALLEDILPNDFIKNRADLVLDKSSVANFDELNAQLRTLSDWQIIAVNGLFPDVDFFYSLQEKKFPVNVAMRKPHEIDFAELPDLFHDIYGHVPMLLNNHITSFVLKLSEIALKHINNPEVIKMIGRLYWFTIETGVIEEAGTLKPYGAAILSSKDEINNVYDKFVAKHDFDVVKLMQTEFENLDLQKEYFVIDSFETLYNCTHKLEGTLMQLCEAEPLRSA